MDDEIAAVYAGSGLDDVRPRFAPAVLELRARGPLTIRDLAAAVGVTHSAMSQTVTAMRGAGLVESVPVPRPRSRTRCAAGPSATAFTEHLPPAGT